MGFKTEDWRCGIGGPCAALLSLIFGMSAAVAVSGEVIDRVLAIAAGDIITLTDVNAARTFRLVPVDGGADGMREILSRLIERSLILAEVERYAPPEPAADAIDRELERVRARFQKPGDFDAALARSGIDERHVRETLRQDLRMTAYMNQRFTAADERRGAAVNEWLAGLRRRADVIDLYLTGDRRP